MGEGGPSKPLNVPGARSRLPPWVACLSARVTLLFSPLPTSLSRLPAGRVGGAGVGGEGPAAPAPQEACSPLTAPSQPQRTRRAAQGLPHRRCPAGICGWSDLTTNIRTGLGPGFLFTGHVILGKSLQWPETQIPYIMNDVINVNFTHNI